MATPPCRPAAYIVLDEGGEPVVAGAELTGRVEFARPPRAIRRVAFSWSSKFLAAHVPVSQPRAVLAGAVAAAGTGAPAVHSARAPSRAGRDTATPSLRFSLPVPLHLTTHEGAAFGRAVSLCATITDGDRASAVELPLAVHAARLGGVPPSQLFHRETPLGSPDEPQPGAAGVSALGSAEALGPYRTGCVVAAAGDRLPAALLRCLTRDPTLAHTARYELARPLPRSFGSEPSVRWACLGGTATVETTCGEGCDETRMGASWKVVCRLWELRALVRADGAGRPLAEDTIAMTFDAATGAFRAPLSADLPPTVVLPEHAVLWSMVLEARCAAPRCEWPLFVVPFRTDAYGLDPDRAPGSRRRALLAALQRAR